MTAAASFALVLAAGFVIGFHVKHRIGRAYRDRQRDDARALVAHVTAVEMECVLLRRENLGQREMLAAFGRDVLA